MRHSDIRLTHGTYTDPKALHPAAALDALPSFNGELDRERMRATGTYDPGRSALGVLLGGTKHLSGHGDAKKCAGAGGAKGMAHNAQRAANSPVSTGIHCHSQQRANGLEPSTFSLEG